MANPNGGRGPGRPPHPGPLTPAEVRVHERIREGLTNAEIAVRLGVSVNTVRYHVANLLAKSDLANRKELAGWQPGEGESRARAWFGWLALGGVASRAAIAVAAVVVAGTAVIAVGPSEDGVELPGVPVGPEVTPPPESRASPIIGESTFGEDDVYRPYQAPDLVGLGMVNLGQLVSLPLRPSPGAEIAIRDTFTGVRLAAGGIVVLDGGAVEWSIATNGVTRASLTRASLTGEWEGRELQLSIEVSRPLTSLILSYDDFVAIHTPYDPGPSPEFSMSMVDDEGWRYPVALDAGGELWMAREPLPRDAIIAYDTGRRIDVNGARRLRPARPLDDLYPGTNWCAPARDRAPGACDVTLGYVPESIAAPVSGLLRCLESGGLDLVTDEFTLHLRAAGGSLIPCKHWAAAETEIEEGEPIRSAGYWHLSGTARDGTPLSVVVGHDATLYIGELSTVVECPPCRSGS